MKRITLALFFTLFLCAKPSGAQLASTSSTNGSGAPVGACVSGSTYTDSSTGFIWSCTSSAWTATTVTGYAPLASPAFTGTPTAPTANVNDLSTTLSTTSFFQSGYFRRMIIHGTDGSTTTFQNIGEALPTVTGSTVQAKAFSAGGPAIYATTTSANTAQGFVSPAQNFKIGKNIAVLFVSFLNTLTTERAWYGITDQTLATMMAGDNPAGNYAAFRYSTLGSDTSWQCITKDATTQSVVSSGVVPVSGVPQKFMILFNDTAGNITFYINGSLVATISTHLPTTSTTVSWMLGSINSASGSFQNGVSLNQLTLLTDIP